MSSTRIKSGANSAPRRSIRLSDCGTASLRIATMAAMRSAVTRTSWTMTRARRTRLVSCCPSSIIKDSSVDRASTLRRVLRTRLSLMTSTLTNLMRSMLRTRTTLSRTRTSSAQTPTTQAIISGACRPSTLSTTSNLTELCGVLERVSDTGGKQTHYYKRKPWRECFLRTECSMYPCFFFYSIQ